MINYEISKKQVMEEPIMRHLIYSIAFTLAVLIAIGARGTMAEEAYTPESSDEVVIYVNKFKPESFEEGKMIQVKGFGGAMQESGQTRLTYFLADEENHETVAISFFKKGHETKEWHGHTKRQEVLDKLKPLWRESMTFKKFTLTESHATE